MSAFSGPLTLTELLVNWPPMMDGASVPRCGGASWQRPRRNQGPARAPTEMVALSSFVASANLASRRPRVGRERDEDRNRLLQRQHRG